MASAIQIKGIRDGLLVILGEGEWDQVEGSLLAHIDAQKDFLQGAKVTLEVGNHILKAADLGRLRDLLSDRGIQLKAVLSNSPTTERTAQALGLGCCGIGAMYDGEASTLLGLTSGSRLLYAVSAGPVK